MTLTPEQVSDTFAPATDLIRMPEGLRIIHGSFVDESADDAPVKPAHAAAILAEHCIDAIHAKGWSVKLSPAASSDCPCFVTCYDMHTTDGFIHVQGPTRHAAIVAAVVEVHEQENGDG